MPKGKGTYGSKVGRPPKKKYYGGGSVDPFSLRNPEGVAIEQAMEMLEQPSMPDSEQEVLPTSNAMDRVENYQLGGAVRPPTDPSIQYKKGGKV
jgi:hypothetical protein